MSRKARKRLGSKRASARLQFILGRAAEWQRCARRAAVLAVLAGSVSTASSVFGQTGQTAMTPVGGIANRAVQGFQNLSENGPGWLYYGINAADRGLGYQGSYFTLGGFIPYAEDDLGGLWSADLRSHLSNYGGFFSNVGTVRKQFIGGTLLGVGVYWDYDGDQNQYAPTVITDPSGSYTFAGGQTYNQVGVSGEWLTDWGNLRSNGYIPVGSTAQVMGPFVGNSLLCQTGINAALGGADLEVGAYIPGLSDWAGMISVGGYAYGNGAYKDYRGQDVVPWFGGVYTRLDMTFIKNWDFSLQYNNDSYFDSTGFARLTYRMGGSRRRNVPDQMEQPMMRNEHIVRAHQAPEVALNPETGLPWRVYHVDNSVNVTGGNGTAQSPFATLGQASTAATAAYDIVYVHAGTSSTNNPYITPLDGYTFAASNQYLVGQGSSLQIPTLDCGNLPGLFGKPSTTAYPVISNPVGPALAIDQDKTLVTHLSIVGSPVGISDGTGLAAPGGATIQDVTVAGNGGPSQRGIEIANSTGEFKFENVRLSSLLNSGIVVASGATASITNSSFTNVRGVSIAATGAEAKVSGSNVNITGANGTAVRSSGANAQITLVSSTIANTTGNAVESTGAGSRASLTNMRITKTSGSALVASGAAATISATNSTIKETGSPGIGVTGNSARVTLNNTKLSDATGTGVLLSGPNSRFAMTNKSEIRNVGGDGIFLENATAFAQISGKSLIANTGGNGIQSLGGSVELADSTIQSVQAAGISATGVGNNAGGGNVIWVRGSTIQNAADAGIVAENSNLRVERLDRNDAASRRSTISNTGVYGILVNSSPVTAGAIVTSGTHNVLVENTTISGVSNGIVAEAAPVNTDPLPAAAVVPTINLTANDNQITLNGSGAGISLSAYFDLTAAPDGAPRSRIYALMTGNAISTSAGGEDILLTTTGDPTTVVGGGLIPTPVLVPSEVLPLTISAGSQLSLENLNNGANVVQDPSNSRPNYSAGANVPTPPPPPTPQ